MRVAVFPMPALIDQTNNQPHPFDCTGDVLLRVPRPTFPLVLTMQKIKRPKMEGIMTMILNQKKLRSW